MKIFEQINIVSIDTRKMRKIRKLRNLLLSKRNIILIITNFSWYARFRLLYRVEFETLNFV